MDKPFSLKRLFLRIVLLIPLIYIGFGWYVGLNYGQKSVIFGPYKDIPVVMKDSLLGSSLSGTVAKYSINIIFVQELVFFLLLIALIFFNLAYFCFFR